MTTCQHNTVTPKHSRIDDERLKCKYCNTYTQCCEPIFIKRPSINTYKINAKCAVCGKRKNCQLNKKQIKLLPEELKNMPVGTEIANSVTTKEGGLLPLAALIPLILGGITAATTVAGTTAKTVIDAKRAAEEKRHNQEMEKAAQQVAKGASLFVKPDCETGLREAEMKEMMNKLQGSGFVFV